MDKLEIDKIDKNLEELQAKFENEIFPHVTEEKMGAIMTARSVKMLLLKLKDIRNREKLITSPQQVESLLSQKLNILYTLEANASSLEFILFNKIV